MSSDRKGDFTPNSIASIFFFLAGAAWLIDIVINRGFSIVGFVYFIAALIFAILWKTQAADKADFLLTVCKNVLVGVGTSCILAFFAIAFNQPVGNFILSRYVEGNTIAEAVRLQAAGEHKTVIQLADEPIIKEYAPYARQKLQNIRRVSEDAMIVAGGDTTMVKQQ